jgi:dinuclear metal center YbgI/SA1388 family protein
MSLARDQVLSALRALSPEHLAEPWDNVGLLVDPQASLSWSRALITIDLTPATLAEAEQMGADLVIAYHPPIFSGIKRLRASQPGEALVVRALCGGISIYSPHTALDAAPGGMNDWLAQALGPGTSRPIIPALDTPLAGAGRLVTLEVPLTIEEAVERAKAHLGLPHVRLARAETDQKIRTLAVCPGAGGSVFEKVAQADLFLTGEMRHHDVLVRKARGTHVILTDHTNTERGFLPHYAASLVARCPGFEVKVASLDADPLQIV